MIPTAIVLLELLGYSIVLSRYAKIPLTVSPAVVAAMVVLVLYAADFAGLMYPAAIAMHAAGLILLVGSLIREYQSRKSIRPPGVTAVTHGPEITAIGLLLLAFYLKQAPGAFWSWDEFSHWGTMIKVTYLANSFHFTPSPLIFEDIPPGSALFIYFVLTVIGYSEGHSIFAYTLLTVLFLLPLIGQARHEGWSMAIVVGTLALYLVSTLCAGWSSVLIETHLAVVAAGALLIYFRTRDHAWNGLWTGVALALLALLKQSGQSLALLIGCIILVDRLIFVALAERRPANFSFSNPMIPMGRAALGVIALPVLIIWSWNWHVAADHLEVSLGGQAISPFLAKIYDCCTSEREAIVAGRFFARHFGLWDSSPRAGPILELLYSSMRSAAWSKGLNSLGNIPVAILALELYFAALILSLLLADRRERIHQLVIHSALAAGFCAYSGGILLFFFYGFSDYEGTRLASYARYHSVYLLMWSLLVLYLASKCLARFGRFDSTPVRIVLLVLALTPVFYEYNIFYDMRTFLTDSPLPGLSEKRAEIRHFLKGKEKYIPGPARVYIVWQRSNGFEFYLVKHEIAPKMANEDCFSIGKPMYKGDVWTCDMTQDRFREILSTYDYVLVGNGLQSLGSQFGSMMDGVPPEENSGLLRIDRLDGQLKLHYVETDR